MVESRIILELCTFLEGATMRLRSVVRMRRLACDRVDHTPLAPQFPSCEGHVKGGLSCLHFPSQLLTLVLDFRHSFWPLPAYQPKEPLISRPHLLELHGQGDGAVRVRFEVIFRKIGDRAAQIKQGLYRHPCALTEDLFIILRGT